MNKRNNLGLDQLPEGDRLRAIEISAGVERTGQICKAITVGFLAVAVVVGLGMICNLLLNADARAFLAPYGWVLLLLAFPSTLVVPMAKVFRQRSKKTTRRTRELEILIDSDRTSSLPEGEADDEEEP